MGVGMLRLLRFPEPRGVSVPYQVLIRIDGLHLSPWIVDRRDEKIAAQIMGLLAQLPFVSPSFSVVVSISWPSLPSGVAPQGT